MQLYVNKHPDSLSQYVIEAAPGIARDDAHFDWVSPLQGKHYAEYWDQDFLDALDLSAFRQQLASFWPKRGPHWDALAKIKHAGGTGVVLVEAKAHPTEIYNKTGSGASPESRKIIEASLHRTCEWLKVPYQPIWTGSLYQSANRLAHLYFLREVVGVDAWLVNIYFLDDHGYKSTSRDQWTPVIAKVKAELGLAKVNVPYFCDVFPPALQE